MTQERSNRFASMSPPSRSAQLLAEQVAKRQQRGRGWLPASDKAAQLYGVDWDARQAKPVVQPKAKPAGAKSSADIIGDRITGRLAVEEQLRRGAAGPAEPEADPEPEKEPVLSKAEKQMRAARTYRTYLAEELAKAAGGPGAA